MPNVENFLEQLDNASPGDVFDVAVILEPSSVKSDTAPVDPSNIAEGRKAFANRARRVLNSIIDDVSRGTGYAVVELTVFDHLASARLRAPAELIKQLIAHPSVAVVRPITGEVEKS